MVEGSTRGRPTSWLAVLGIILGFIVGGVGVAATTLWVVILGAVIIVVAGIFGLATGIMDDVH